MPATIAQAPNAPTIERPADLARFIDHTILKPDATDAQVEAHAAAGLVHGFRAVCVNPVHARRVAGILAGSDVAVCAVAGFPLGASTNAAKAAEAAGAVEDGAGEIDMVIDIGALRSGETGRVGADIAAVRRAVPAALLKVIIECCLLDETQKRLACRLSIEAGADYVKTSTGFSTGGATVEDVALMRAEVGRAGIKASGGIRSFAQAKALIEAGATRIGASDGTALLR